MSFERSHQENSSPALASVGETLTLRKHFSTHVSTHVNTLGGSLRHCKSAGVPWSVAFGPSTNLAYPTPPEELACQSHFDSRQRKGRPTHCRVPQMSRG